MDKTQLLIKELQMHVGKEELNSVIEEKMMDVWRVSRQEKEADYVRYSQEFNARQKASLTKEERERMEKSHHWQDTSEFGDTECSFCKIDERAMFNCPQYCIPRCKECRCIMADSVDKFGEPIFVCQNEKCHVNDTVISSSPPTHPEEGSL